MAGRRRPSGTAGTVEIVQGWADMVGVEVPLEVPPEKREAARAAAFRLFDAFFADQK